MTVPQNGDRPDQDVALLRFCSELHHPSTGPPVMPAHAGVNGTEEGGSWSWFDSLLEFTAEELLEMITDDSNVGPLLLAWSSAAAAAALCCDAVRRHPPHCSEVIRPNRSSDTPAPSLV